VVLVVIAEVMDVPEVPGAGAEEILAVVRDPAVGVTVATTDDAKMLGRDPGTGNIKGHSVGIIRMLAINLQLELDRPAV